MNPCLCSERNKIAAIIYVIEVLIKASTATNISDLVSLLCSYNAFSFFKVPLDYGEVLEGEISQK